MSPITRIPSDPHLGRWMLFVDGENLTIRAQQLSKEQGFTFTEGPNYLRDVFVWIPNYDGSRRIEGAFGHLLRSRAVRAFYYTSVKGDDKKLDYVREVIWKRGFNPQVFKRSSGQTKAKGVDIALTKDMLSNAYLDNYDYAVLLAGDGDYVPLVEEVKRLGKVVIVMTFEGKGLGLSRELMLSADIFFAIDEPFGRNWKAHG